MKKLNLLIILLTAFVVGAMTQEVVEDILPEMVVIIEEEAKIAVIVEEEPVLDHTVGFEPSAEETTTLRKTGLGDNKKVYYEGYPFNHLAIGINVGMYGPGFEINTPIIPNIKARFGLNYLNIGFLEINVDGFEYKDAAGIKQNASADIEPNLRFLNGKLLFDFLPGKKGIFAFTAGTYIGKNSISLIGTAFDEYGNPLRNDVLNFGDGILVHTDANGKVDAEVCWGNVVKPYFGITLGRAIPKHRVGFKFEMGAIYQKARFKLISDGGTNEAVAEANNNVNSILDNLPKGVNKLLNFWPMLSFQLTYKLW